MTTQRRIRYAMMFLLLLAIGCGKKEATAETPAPAAAPAAPSGATGNATVTGTVTLDGAAPAAAKVAMDADPVCQMQHGGKGQMTEDVAVTDGKLQNVFVYVKSGLSGTFPAPTTPAKLDQHGCWYQPHVIGLQVNQPLEIVNSDGTLHNINAKPVINQPFNVAQPVQGMKTTKKFAKPEIGITVKCNVHPWMHAYIHVVDHPFFSVTDASGAFSLQGLPAGTYTLEAWHEKLGTATQTVAIGAGETKNVQFSFKAK